MGAKVILKFKAKMIGLDTDNPIRNYRVIFEGNGFMVERRDKTGWVPCCFPCDDILELRGYVMQYFDIVE